MPKLPTILPLIAALLFSSAPAAQPSSTTNATIELANPAQVEMAEWALGRFAAAGLELPPLTIRFVGPDLAACDGSRARAYLDHDPIEVRICWNDQLIVLHELAHVWEADNVPADQHEPFMEMREGVEAWASREVAWEARGREHAANVIAWGLLERPYPVSQTYPNDSASMIEAFRFLTNTDPIHDGGPELTPVDRTQFRSDNVSLESGR